MKICETCEKIKKALGLEKCPCCKNLKGADWAIIIGFLVIIAVVIAVFTGGNKFISKSPVLEEKDVQFSVFFRGITITDTKSPFLPNEDTFITIRNVPYTKLKITDVVGDRRKMLLETNKMGNYQPVDDISQPAVYDFVVTVQDKAKITDDGAVVGGNKIKMGIPVILEGKNYKFTGVISNIQYVDEPQQAQEVQPQQPQQPQQQTEQTSNDKK